MTVATKLAVDAGHAIDATRPLVDVSDQLEEFDVGSFSCRWRSATDALMVLCLSYARNDIDFTRGRFRIRGDSLEIWPAHYEDMAWRLSFFGEDLESIHEFDPLTGAKSGALDRIRIYANSHYVTPRPTMQNSPGCSQVGSFTFFSRTSSSPSST